MFVCTKGRGRLGFRWLRDGVEAGVRVLVPLWSRARRTLLSFCVSSVVWSEIALPPGGVSVSESPRRCRLPYIIVVWLVTPTKLVWRRCVVSSCCLSAWRGVCGRADAGCRRGVSREWRRVVAGGPSVFVLRTSDFKLVCEISAPPQERWRRPLLLLCKEVFVVSSTPQDGGLEFVFGTACFLWGRRQVLMHGPLLQNPFWLTLVSYVGVILLLLSLACTRGCGRDEGREKTSRRNLAFQP